MSWVAVAAPADIPPGEARVVEIEDERLAICNVDGAFYAIDDECTHDGGSLDQGRLEGTEIECPRHGARFDVTSGKVLCLPAVRNLRSYATRVCDGAVEVALP